MLSVNYAQCCKQVNMLSVVMLNVIMLSVVMMNVVVPTWHRKANAPYLARVLHGSFQ
jgi:hypothetical protein